MSSGGDGPRPATTAEAIACLGFWQAIEAFSPQEPPSVDDVDQGPRDRDRVAANAPRCVDLILGDAATPECLPWEYPAETAYPPGHRFAADDKAPRWRHQVVLGLVPLAQLEEELVTRFGDDGQGTAELRAWASKHQFGICSFAVDSLGMLDIESLDVSSVAWALGKLGRSRLDLDGFEEFRADLQRQCRVAWEEHRQVVEGPVERPDLAWLLAWVLEKVQWSPASSDGRWRAGDRSKRARAGVCLSVKRKPDRPATADLGLLNSFYLADIEAVRQKVAQGAVGKALHQYLGLEMPPDRRCVRSEPVFRRWLQHPGHRPLGRWPAPSTQPLNAGQLAAICGAFVELGRSTGLFAVNGPPGTGKTTLLRDVVAEVVVQRALHLRDYATPAQAFGPKLPVPGSPQAGIYPLKYDLSGYGIVATSANNEAVFNITRELPQATAIGEEWRGSTDYFSAEATSVLRGARGGDGAAWGLLAAALGNRSLRAAFVRDFWFGGKIDGEDQPSLRMTLREEHNTGWHIGDWRRAVDRFEAALEVEQVLREEAVAAAALVDRSGEVEATWERLTAALVVVERRLDALGAALSVAQEDLEAADQGLSTAMAHVGNHRAAKPSWLDRLRRRGSTARWRAALVELNQASLEAAADRNERRRQVAELTGALGEARAEREALRSQIAAGEETRWALAKVRDRFGAHFPCGPGADPDADPDAEELQSPWSTPEWERARTEVFLAALELHRQFVIGARQQLRTNLGTIVGVLSGSIGPRQLGRHLRDAWASLFLVVPVVSTTLASFPRLFAGMGQESLGWLLIDEAGQVAPQYAVGALWRSRRALVVGDPFQLEPIVTVPAPAVDAVAGHFGVERTWVPPEASAQTLADRASRIGTTSNGLWVGAPLRVHRRCADPMFRVANEIAYEGTMVHAVEAPTPNEWWETSAWWQVAGTADRLQWVADQGEKLAELLEELDDQASWFVITPYRAIASELRGRVGHLQPEGGGRRIGTIHTFQGKEADVVFLVLGTDPGAVGSRQWAGSKPNLLNVAVTRARTSIQVVGDRALWAGVANFSVLASALEDDVH